MPILTNVSLQFNGVNEYLENTIRQAMGIANLWTITIWMKPFETSSLFDSEGRQLFRPDGKALLHFKGASHRNEILIWGDRIEDATTEEFIVVENWDQAAGRIRVTRFNMAQKRNQWRLFSCAWNGSTLIAWDNGLEVTDFSQTLSGSGSFIQIDPPSSGTARSLRLAAAYSGTSQDLEGPRIVAYSGLLGPVGVWDEVLTEGELGAVVSGSFGFDLTTDSGTYTSSANNQHWWRLGADDTDLGFDYATTGSINVGDDATVSATNIVEDSPT